MGALATLEAKRARMEADARAKKAQMDAWEAEQRERMAPIREALQDLSEVRVRTRHWGTITIKQLQEKFVQFPGRVELGDIGIGYINTNTYCPGSLRVYQVKYNLAYSNPKSVEYETLAPCMDALLDWVAQQMVKEVAR